MSTVTVTTREAAAALHLSVRTVQRRCAAGQLDALKVGGRWAITLPVEGIEDFKPFQVEKATELLEQGGIVAISSRPGRYRAVSGDGTVTYLVDAVARSCTCKAGERGVRCYHLAAALMAATIRRAA